MRGQGPDSGHHEPQREAGGVRGPGPHRPAGGADREGAPGGNVKNKHTHTRVEARASLERSAGKKKQKEERNMKISASMMVRCSRTGR